MTTPIIPFPPRGAFAVRVQHVDDGWLVLCRSYGWLHADRSNAIQDANVIASDYGVSVAVSS